MDLALTSAQKSFGESVRSFVHREATHPRLVELMASGQDWNPGWLPQFARAGWLGILVSEELGGSGADPLTAAILLEELGRGPVPSPLLASSVVSVLLLSALSPSSARDALLSGIADGSKVVIPALRSPESSWRGVLGSRSPVTAGGAKLSGSKIFVPYAAAGTHFLVTVSGEGLASNSFAAIAADAPGVEVRRLGGFMHASYEVTFTNVDLSASNLLPVPDVVDFDDALAIGRVALAAYQFGGCQSLLDMSVSYSGSREQFGVPIGRFQRVQDHIVRIVNALDVARWITYDAAWAIEAGRNGAARSYLAAAVAGDAYVEAANAAHEVHAGIGSDPAFGLTLYTQASRSLYEFLGTPLWNRRKLVQAMAWAELDVGLSSESPAIRSERAS
jgi:alkylation response protein AidB-like acyl-CoA dehydrogenase